MKIVINSAGAFLVWIALIFGLATGCTTMASQEAAGIYRTHCGNCHQLPDPARLPKSVWQEMVLPEMGARLGIRSVSYDPLAGLSAAERTELAWLGVYPEGQVISVADWEKLHRYVMEYAPDSLLLPKQHNLLPLRQFRVQPVVLGGQASAVVTLVHIDAEGVTAGNVFGQIWQWKPGTQPKFWHKADDPVVDYERQSGSQWITEMGIMPPTQLTTGRLWQITTDSIVQFAQGLHRPVQTEIMDLDEDGTDEVLICEFGHHSGRLSLYSKNEEGCYTPRDLLNIPGIIQVKPIDLNADGLKDLLVLATQGQEGVYVLYQEEPLRFSNTRLLAFTPESGTTWMELADMNADGLEDIVLVQGDNADYSFVSKPYHGVRIFENDGTNVFQEAYFQPIFGATQLEVADFDRDGDLDMAVVAYFPDYQRQPEASFVYLDNVSNSVSGYAFRTYTFPEASKGRWRVMSAGDFDADGDMDLALGSFIHSGVPTPPDLLKGWKEANIDVILLENLLFDWQ